MRRAAPLVVLLGGTAAFAALSMGEDAEPRTAAAEQASMRTVHGSAVGEFKEGEAPQETAMQIIQMAVENNTYKAFTELGVGEDTDVLEILEDLPVYNQANEALDMAGSDVLPDAGDKLMIELDVTVDNNKHVSYEVTDAKIIDIENNRE